MPTRLIRIVRGELNNGLLPFKVDSNDSLEDGNILLVLVRRLVLCLFVFLDAIKLKREVDIMKWVVNTELIVLHTYLMAN